MGNGAAAAWLARARSWPRPVRAAALVALLGAVLAVAATLTPATEGADRLATAAPSTTAGPRTTTTERQVPSTTVVTAPEGGTRAGSTEDLPDDGATVGPDELARGSAPNELLATLAALQVEAEHARTGYDRDLFEHWDDEDRDRCDTRCEVLAAQRHADGSWLSEWDGYVTSDPAELHVDHVVALAEAWDSGADRWPIVRRDAFADEQANLLAVTAASNLRKGDKDAAEWFPSRSAANCLWASTVVHVKATWDLSVDRAEADALGNLLRTCDGYRAPSTTTAAPATTTVAPTTTAAAASSGCTPGYSPCIAPGDDVDCSGGSGNGPRYVDGPVTVDPASGDPYDLDRDGDGVACE